MLRFTNLIFAIALMLGLAGCQSEADAPHQRTLHSSTNNDGFLVTWQKTPSRVGDATAFTVVAVNASSPINLPTNVPPAWMVVKTNNDTVVVLSGTAPIGSSIAGLSLDFSAEFSGMQQSTNILIHPAAFVSEDKNPNFTPCPGTQLVLCHNVALPRRFEGDTNMLSVTVKIDSTGSASDSGNVVRFEAGQSTKEETLVSGGKKTGIYESVETHSGLPNWLVTSGSYRVVVRGRNIKEVQVHGIQTVIP